MSSRDQLLLEQAYKGMLIEQQRLIEEGKIWDFIKGAGAKLTNAWSILNTKIAANPKLYKGLMVAGPIIASLVAKNFQHLHFDSDTVKSFLETLNGIDPNSSDINIQNIISKWDHDHISLSQYADGNNSMHASNIEISQETPGHYAVGGSHVTSTGTETPGGEHYIQTHETSSESVIQTLKGSDLQTVFKNFNVSIIRDAATNGQGGGTLVEFSGIVPASSAEEAMKLVSELIKNAVAQSGIDITLVKLDEPHVAIIAATESIVRESSIYLIELAALDRFKTAAKSIASGVKGTVTGAQNLINKIKSSFRKNVNTPEQTFQFKIQATLPF